MPEPLVRRFDGNAKLADGTATDKLNEIVDAINALNAQLESLRPPLGVADDPHRHFFFAKIVARAVTAGQWRYSWNEVHKKATKYNQADNEGWTVLATGRSGTVSSDPAYCFEDDIYDSINTAGPDPFKVGSGYVMSDGFQQPPTASSTDFGLREMLPNMLGQVVQMHIVHRAGENWEPGSSASQVPRSPAQEDMSEASAEFWFHKSIDKAAGGMVNAYFYDRPTDALPYTIDDGDMNQTGYVHLTLSTGIKRVVVDDVDTVFAYYRPVVFPVWAIRRLGAEWRAPLLILDDDCT